MLATLYILVLGWLAGVMNFVSDTNYTVKTPDDLSLLCLTFFSKVLGFVLLILLVLVAFRFTWFFVKSTLKRC